MHMNLLLYNRLKILMKLELWGTAGAVKRELVQE